MLFLTEPSSQYKESFIIGLQEFQFEGRMLNFDLQRTTVDFESFLSRIQTQKDRLKISPMLVPSNEFWLIEEGEYIGTLWVRPELNTSLLKIGGHIGYQVRPSKRRQGYGKKLLQFGLAKARELGLTLVLVTCDENNLASKKVIEYNGGVFENALFVEGSSISKLRYWIDLAY